MNLLSLLKIKITTMKLKFTSLILLLSVFSVMAQKSDTTYWTKGGLNSLTFSQVSLTNWAAGGQSSVAVNGSAALYGDYKKGRMTWENSLNIAYGVIQQGEADFTKSDDLLNFVTKYGHQIKKGDTRWFFSGLLDFRTQFTKGYATAEQDTAISTFLAPGYLLVGAGIDFKPSAKLSINYVPVTGKFTFVTDEKLSKAGAYGVDPGKKSRAELGSYLRFVFKDEILTNVNLESRLELFSNYVENFGNIDVNWQNGLVMKVNKFLTANFFTQLLYDDDIDIEIDNNNDGIIDEKGPRVQFKSVLGIGLAWNIGDSKSK